MVTMASFEISSITSLQLVLFPQTLRVVRTVLAFKIKIKMAELALVITASLISFLFYITGIYFHSKIIKVSLKDKEMSWQLDVIYSCVRVTQNTISYLFYAITYLIPNLSLYTGEWFCYAYKLLLQYNSLIFSAHSFIVAVLKYVVIVHWQKSREIGHDRIKKLFSVIGILIYPMFINIAFFALRPDVLWAYDGFKQVDLCLGDPKNIWVEGSNTTQTKLYDICWEIYESHSENDFQYFFQILLPCGLCWIQIICMYAIFFNLMDMIVYHRIFSAARR